MARDFIDWSDWILAKNDAAKEEMSKDEALVAKLKAMRETAPKGGAGTPGGHLKSAMGKLSRMRATVQGQANAKAATAAPKGDTKPVSLPKKFQTVKTGGTSVGAGIVKPTMPHAVPPKP